MTSLTPPGFFGTPPLRYVGAKWRIAGLEYAVQRLKRVIIENDDALNVLARYDSPDTVFYVDPPYVMRVRSKGSRSRYRHEYNDADHRHLATALHSLQGMVLLSGYAGDLYRELFGTWRSVSQPTRTNGHSTATEVLWLNPAADRALQQAAESKPEQMEMFA
jgi:DNA adenine methylase